MSESFPLPSSYHWGKVVGRVIYAIADTAEDVDDKPQARAAAGKVLFKPQSKGGKVVDLDYPAIVMNSTVTANLSSTGRILDAEGRQGIWLIEGIYEVSFDFTATIPDGLKGSLPAFLIEVTADHTDAAPLDLAVAVPAAVPSGATVTTLVVPAGGIEGQILARAAGGQLVWTDPPDPVEPGVSSWEDLEDKPAVIAAGPTAADARAAIGAQVAGAYLTSLPDATASAKGVVELATTAEAVAGSDAVRAVTPAGLKAAVDALVSGAPGALDTLSELAAALGNDPSFATTVTNALASRVRADTASQGLTATQQGNARANVGLAAAPVEVIWTGSAWRIVGTAVNLSARPTTGPLILVGGSVANRPTWANQDGDIHFPES